MIERGLALWQWVQTTRPWRAFSHFTNVGGGVLSAGMSYQALFAVFAALWVGFGVFGLVLDNHPELLESLVTMINTAVPGLIGKSDEGLVHTDDLLAARTLNWTSIVAGVSLLLVAMNWFTGTRRAIRLIFELEVKQYKNAVLLKLRDFCLALAFGLALVVSAALTVLSSSLTDLFFSWLDWNPESWFLGSLGVMLRYAAMCVFDILVLMAMHRYLAEVVVPWRRLLIGCTLGGVALLGIKVLGTALLGGATNNPLLASFALLIGLLIWFNIICRVLLLTSSWIATGVNRELGLPPERTE